MAHIASDRVQESTTTTGTGTLTLAGALTNYVSFSSVMSNNDTCWYAIVDSTNNAWETGLGTYQNTNLLARTTVIASSNSNAAVSLGVGSKNVFISPIAAKTLIVDVNSTVKLPDGGTGSITSPPSADPVHMFSRTVANRKLIAMVDGNGSLSSVQPILARNKVGYWNPQGNATTVPGVFGITALTASGTATARTVTTGAVATMMRRIGYPSATSSGSLAGARINVAQFTAGSGSNDGSGFMLIERFVESDPASVTGRRAFAGMTSATGAPSNVEPSSLTNAIGVGQISTDATQWYWIQGGSSAQSAVAIGGSVGAPAGNSTTAWEIAIYAPNAVANTFYLQLTNLTTGSVATTSMSGNATVVPQSSTLLAWRHWACNNATALAVGVDICSIYIETDN